MNKQDQTFHKFWLSQVKAKTKASFVAWEESKGVLRLKVVKDKQPNYFILDGSFDNVTPETYLSLLEAIEK